MDVIDMCGGEGCRRITAALEASGIDAGNVKGVE